jgi:hypothetical protein
MSAERRELFAWIVTEADSNTTAIVLLKDPRDGQTVPAVDLNRRVAGLARQFIVESGEANRRHAPVRLVRFVEVETLDTVMPHA